MRKIAVIGMLALTMLAGCTSEAQTETVSKQEKKTEKTQKIFTKKDIKQAEQIGLDFFETVEQQKTYAFRDLEYVQEQLKEKNRERLFNGKNMLTTQVRLPQSFGMNGYLSCTDKPTNNMCTVQFQTKKLKVGNVEEKYYSHLGVHSLQISYAHPKMNEDAKEVSMYVEFVKLKDGKIIIYDGDFLSNMELSQYNDDARYDEGRKEKLRKEIEKDGVQ
ncbi:hypothetical protein [Bacillus cereus]|uniref:Lipoprotein n=1 Tax=Bacillus cereus TaxID=1396 RepID=A0A9X7QMS0_BACCE|nr:hypothetical protein [Bacillus cereus]QDZ76839.1 hypothetical protein D0437_28915 [Bacillus cereus]